MSDTPQKNGAFQAPRRRSNRSVPANLRNGSPAANPSDTGSALGGLTPAFVFRALGQWWKVATPLGMALGAVAIAVIWLRFEPQYESQALLRIAEVKPSLIYATKDNAQRFERTQIGLIGSSLVMDVVLAQPDIARFSEIMNEENPARWLSKNVKVEAIKGSELYIISFASLQAEHASTIVNAVADAYFDLQQSEERRRTHEIIRLLELEKKKREIEVTRLRTNVRDLTKDITGIDPLGVGGESRIFLNNPLSTLHQQLIDTEVEREMLNAQIAAFETSIKENTVSVSAATVSDAVEQHEEVQRYRQLISYNETLLSEIAAAHVLEEKAPPYARLAKEIEKYQKSLDELRKKLHVQFSEVVKQRQTNAHKDDLAMLKARSSNHQFKEQLLRDRYEKMVKNTTQSSGQSLQLEFLRAELAREEKVFELISSRIVQLITEIVAPARVRLLKPAKVAAAPIERYPVKIMSIAGLAGLLLPFCLAVFWEKIVCRVDNVKQLKLSNLDVVGEIARIPNRSRVWTLSGKSERGLNLYEESVDSLRTGLILSDQGKDVNVLAVTSAVSREGKTSLSSQLAVSIASASGKPTLLIDGDMRSPDIHNVFEIDNDKGLAQVLAGDCELDEAIITNWSSHLHLLPAGPLKTSPHKLLGQGAFDKALSELRETYSYIVIDTPPVLSASESLILSKSADATLLCTMREVSRLDQVTAAHERLTASGASPVGTVLNGVHASRYAYHYGSYAYQRS